MLLYIIVTLGWASKTYNNYLHYVQQHITALRCMKRKPTGMRWKDKAITHPHPHPNPPTQCVSGSKFRASANESTDLSFFIVSLMRVLKPSPWLARSHPTVTIVHAQGLQYPPATSGQHFWFIIGIIILFMQYHNSARVPDSTECSTCAVVCRHLV